LDSPVIHMAEVTVAYREREGLSGIDLTVGRGEFLIILGPNGAGKTTLLNVINGLRRPTAGRVRVLGQDISRGAPLSLRKQIGYVPQGLRFSARLPLNVREAVESGRAGVRGLLRRYSRADRDLVAQVLELTGLANLADRPVGLLSGGEQQRLLIARSLAQEPALFLLDEPAASLDYKGQREILQLVAVLHRERRLTTMLVTHDLAYLPREADRVVLLKQGRIYGAGAPRDWLTPERLSALYDIVITGITWPGGES
jgi:ABC-type cobalamin/Fe3+-siderophores transport system ATPase subunit